jgi:hypothetical protein
MFCIVGVQLHMHEHTYVRTYVCIYICMYVCTYGCMYVCRCVCTYVRIYVSYAYVRGMYVSMYYVCVCINLLLRKLCTYVLCMHARDYVCIRIARHLTDYNECFEKK